MTTTALADPRCHCCTHPARAEIEAALVAGQRSLRSVAQQYELGRDSLRRHLQRHVPIADRPAFEGTPGASAADLIDRLFDVLAHAEEIRADADAADDKRMGLAADRMIDRVTATLADRFGVTKGEITRDLGDMQAMSRAIIRASQETPAVAERLAVALRQNGDIALAKTIEGFADRRRAALTTTQTA